MGDSGLDDQKIFSQVARVDGQFIFRVSHDNRLVDVFNERLQRWEPQEHLADLAANVPWSLHLPVAFQHAHTKRHVTVSLGWLRLRIPSTQQTRLGLGSLGSRSATPAYPAHQYPDHQRPRR